MARIVIFDNGLLNFKAMFVSIIMKNFNPIKVTVFFYQKCKKKVGKVDYQDHHGFLI